METVVEKVAHAYFQALVDGKIDDWVNLFADDAVSYDPVTFPPQDVNRHEGKVALRKFLSGFVGLFKTVALYERHVLSNGNDAAVRWEGIGVGLNGVSVSFHGFDVLSVNPAGKIQTVYAFWDPTPVLKVVKG
jgi:steroid delta-isomerase